MISERLEFCGPPDRSVRQVFDPHQEVKVIAQQAIGKCPRDRLDVFQVELQKVAIVALFDENVLAIVAAIIDVIVQAVLKRNRVHVNLRKT